MLVRKGILRNSLVFRFCFLFHSVFVGNELFFITCSLSLLELLNSTKLAVFDLKISGLTSFPSILYGSVYVLSLCCTLLNLGDDECCLFCSLFRAGWVFSLLLFSNFSSTKRINYSNYDGNIY